MEKILDFLHISLGDKLKREESSDTHSITANAGKKSVTDKCFQFPEPEEPQQAGVGQFVNQEESHHDEGIHTPELRKPGKNVAVKNLPRLLKKGELEKILSAGPKPKNITFVRNNGKFHGMVLIKYPTAQDAALAVASLNGSQVKGKPIIVEYKKKTKKDKPKGDSNKHSESDSPDESANSTPVQGLENSMDPKSDTEKVEAGLDKFMVPFRRHSIAYPNSAWRKNSGSFAGFDSDKSAMLRRNSIAYFGAPDPNNWSEVLPAFSPIRQPKGPDETCKGFSVQAKSSRSASLASE